MENHQIARRVALLAGHGGVAFTFVNEAILASRNADVEALPWMCIGIVVSSVGAAFAYLSMTTYPTAEKYERYSLIIIGAWVVALLVMALGKLVSG